jgi:hypothetical protein
VDAQMDEIGERHIGLHKYLYRYLTSHAAPVEPALE